MNAQLNIVAVIVTASALFAGCGDRQSDIDELIRDHGDPVLTASAIELRDGVLTLYDPQPIEGGTFAANGRFVLFSRLQVVRVDMAMLLATPRVDPIPSEAAVDYQLGDFFYCHLSDEGVASHPETGEVQSIKVE